MRLSEYEQALLSVILQNENAIKILRYELTAEKFSYGVGGVEGGAHQLIYQSAIDCHIRGVPPDVMSVERELGSNLEDAGGRAYLRELVGILRTIGIMSVTDGSIRNWARIVDNLGRLRQLGEVVSQYNDVLIDRERALNEVEDVDQFITELIRELWKAQGIIESDYTHISVGAGEFRRRLGEELKGRSIQIPSIGWPSFQAASLPFMGGMTVIAGLPGSGKTQLALQIMLGQIIQCKLNNLPGCVAINSFEMSAWRLVSRLACCLAQVDSTLIRKGEITPESPEAYRIMEWTEFLEDLPIYVDDSVLTTSSRINWQSSALHAVNGPLLNLVVDYVELTAMSESDERQSRERQISMVFQNVAAIGKVTGCAATALSQYNRSVNFSKSKIAGPAALRYSGMGYQATDVLLEIWNPISMANSQTDFTIPPHLSGDCAWILVEKYKDGPAGTVFPMNWEGKYTRFSDPKLYGVGADLYQGLSSLMDVESF